MSSHLLQSIQSINKPINQRFDVCCFHTACTRVRRIPHRAYILFLHFAMACNAHHAPLPQCNFLSSAIHDLHAFKTNKGMDGSNNPAMLINVERKNHESPTVMKRIGMCSTAGQ